MSNISKGLVLPFLHLHAIRGASLNLLGAHFFPVCRKHCPIGLHLVQFKNKYYNAILLVSDFQGNLQDIAKTFTKISNTRKEWLTKDFLMALLVSSSASLYISWKNLFKAASPSSFSSFSWNKST